TDRDCCAALPPGPAGSNTDCPKSVQAKTARNRPCPIRRAGLFAGRPPPRAPGAMSEFSPSAEFLDTVAVSVRDALAALGRHEASLEEVPVSPGEPEQAFAGA